MAWQPEQLYPSAIEAKYLGRLALLVDSASDDDSISSALAILREAGLEAKESRRDPATILGGIAARQSSMGLLFEKAFTIEPDRGEFSAVVTGPGNLSKEWRLPTRREAASRVIEEYRARDELPRSSRI
jgi:hypothetical protein